MTTLTRYTNNPMHELPINPDIETVKTARRTCPLCQATEWVHPIDLLSVGQCPVCECSYIPSPDNVHIPHMTDEILDTLIPRQCD